MEVGDRLSGDGGEVDVFLQIQQSTITQSPRAQSVHGEFSFPMSALAASRCLGRR
jgi:hypothetical protein